MIGVVESRADEASELICDQLREVADLEERTDPDRPDADGGGTYYRSPAVELRSFDALHLDLDGVAEAFDDPDVVAFASRHSGDTGPLLSTHATGNFGEAKYGGEPGTLAEAAPRAMAAVLASLREHAPAGYDVGLECTHHGPTDVGVPSLFAELGSGPEQWADPEGARAVARAILDLAEARGDRGDGDDKRDDNAGTASDGRPPRHLVGFGGGHYAPRFTRVALETDWAVGHVAADWSLSDLGDPAANREIVAAAFERSRAEYALVDGDRPDLAATVDDLGYRVVSETWVRETAGVPLSVVEAVEAVLGSVAAGTRFGDPVRRQGDPGGADGTGTDPADAGDWTVDDEWTASESGWTVVDLPGDLVDAAQGIDREAVLDALAETCVAFETEEGGTRAGERALVAGDGLPDALVEALTSILRTRYDAVTRKDGRVVAEETAFDPALARDAGVPEGPAFGKLSNGEPAETPDGDVVEPADVRRERRDVFDLS